MTKKYLIDSNSLISSYRNFYQFNLVPSFWNWFKITYDKSVFLVDKVRDEICHANGENKDDLQIWVEQYCLGNNKIIYPNTDSAVLNEYTKILKHIQQSPVYQQSSYDEWSNFAKADPWLIAIAKIYNYTIVTMEVGDPNLNSINPTRKEPRIPDICGALDVECINLYEFMTKENCVI